MASITQLLSQDEITSIQALNYNETLSTPRSVEHQAKMLEYDLIKERLRPYIIDMTKPMPDIDPLITIDGCPVCTRGNISAICGEAKSRKTFLTTALVASAMAIPCNKLDNFSNVAKNTNINVLWVDTEQGEQHVRRVVNRITQMTGAAMGGAIVEPRLTTLALRELAPHERKNMVYDAMALRHYDIVVIDGIADLQRNTNDLEESDALVAELMKLSTQAQTHIICVLHTNPGSDKARGHLGSSLQRKSEAVLFVHRVGECTIVEPQFCRNEPFERFAFTVSEEGIPRLTELPTEPDNRNDIVAMLEEMYGGSIERTTLINKLMELKNLKKTTAHMRLKRLLDRGILSESNGIINVVNSSNVVNSPGVAPQFTDSHIHAFTEEEDYDCPF